MTKELLEKLRFSERVVNWTTFITGMLIVWFVTHNWLAMGGAFVASINFRIVDYALRTVENDKAPKA